MKGQLLFFALLACAAFGSAYTAAGFNEQDAQRLCMVEHNHGLIYDCDCYVSEHKRARETGVPITNAMLRGCLQTEDIAGFYEAQCAKSNQANAGRPGAKVLDCPCYAAAMARRITDLPGHFPARFTTLVGERARAMVECLR